MANDFYTPGEAAVVAAKLVREDSFLSALVSNNYENDLLGGGKGGAPVSVKIPTTLIARSRAIDDITTSIVLDEIVEQRETINLARVHDYSAVALSEADLTLNLENFSAQVLAPQADAIVDGLEHKVATALLGVPEFDLGVAFDPANPVPYFTRIRKHLRDNGVASEGLQVIAGTEVYAALLDAEAITDVSQSGSTAALREAGVGRIRGFQIVESTRVPENEILAFHRDAVTLVTRAPVVPQGAAFGAAVRAGGFSLRYLRDYDAMHTVDRSIVSTFSGVGILPTFKIDRDYATREVSVERIPNGGVLHLDTTAVTP
jgi:hypothetical protein